MEDRNVQFPQRYQLKKVEGTEDIFDLIPAPGEISSEGTLINKATLWKDATAALFGLGVDSVPDDGFAYLGKYAQHWWKVKKYGSGTYEVSDSSTTVQFSITPSTPWDIRYSDEVLVDVQGNVSLYNPEEKTDTGTGPLESLLNTIKGKFFQVGGGGTGIIAEEATLYKRDTGNAYAVGNTLNIPSLAVTGKAGTFIGTDYTQSENRNAYPDSGFSGTNEYEYLGIPFDNAVGAPKVEVGSYTGTGTYGASNPNSLTFRFSPKLIIVYGMYISGNTYPFNFYNNPPTTSPIGTPDNFTQGCGLYRTTGGTPFGKYDKSAKTFSWYNTASASAQLNESAVYYYVAIG